jgi:hypothetical protein
MADPVMDEDAWKIHRKKLSIGLERPPGVWSAAFFSMYLDSRFSPHVAMWLLLGPASGSYGCHSQWRI